MILHHTCPECGFIGAAYSTFTGICTDCRPIDGEPDTDEFIEEHPADDES